jgi:DNA-binding transcriptional MocR family regulator
MMIAEPGFDRWMGYGAFHGTENQRLAALPILQKAGLQTAQERLIPAGGGQNAIAGILCGLFERGDRLGVDPLTYPGLKTTAKMFGVELIPVRHENGEISEEGLLYALRNEKIRGIYVMPDVQNPTTHVMSEACRAMIAEVAKQKDLLVIEDGANSLTLSETHQAIANLAPEHTVYIGSLSKAIAPALRLAYVASPERFEAPLKDAFHNINLMLSPFLSEFASRMLASDDVLEVIENNRREAVRRNRIFDREMEGYEAAGTDECLFRWLTLPKEIDGAEFERRALEAGVDVYAGYRFAVGKTKPPSALRIAVTSPKTDEDLIEALTKLKQLIEKY